LGTGALAASPARVASFPVDRLPEDEIIYLVMPDRFANGDPRNDRGGISGGREKTGFDPTSRMFYHGGDLRGVIDRLDYIQGLGATAIWLTPVFTNQTVQYEPSRQIAGYHGYWPLNFLDVDPHLGDRALYKAFVDAAHARGLKVYFDIVINHTGDIIQYRECAPRGCAYRSQADYPYSRKGGVQGEAINDGFTGLDGQTLGNFQRLSRQDYAYTPYVPEADRNAKQPAWLNDVRFYHNRGESTFEGENSRLGDFAGLDDVMTEDPRVLAGFIDIYGRWIDDFRVDGFRIDTARHVNPEFWQAFVPAMQKRAAAAGVSNFHIFGEVMNAKPSVLAQHTRVDGLPAVNDFAFQSAILDVVARNQPTAELAEVFDQDVLYEGGAAAARQLVTLIGNHDVLRLGRTVRTANPQASEAELLQRMILANALLLTARGLPALYYGDEQGFTGMGSGDHDSREDMFASQVATYNANRLIGSDATTAVSNFNPTHPLYREIAQLTRLRRQEPALRRGDQITRHQTKGPGLFVFSRRLGGEEVLVAVNTSAQPQTARVQVETASLTWRGLRGQCSASAEAPGTYAVSAPAFSYAICKSRSGAAAAPGQ
jgi:glycosidase